MSTLKRRRYIGVPMRDKRLQVGEEVKLAEAIRFLYDNVPDHVLTNPENSEQLDLVEDLLAENERQHQVLIARGEENERLKNDRDRFQSIVHAVSPYLDPACLGLTPEMASEALRRSEDMYKSLVARIDAALALHTQTDAYEDWDGYCMECSHGQAVHWPCPTVKALRGEE